MDNYHLTPAEIEELETRGFSREEIEGAEHIVYTCDSWIDQKFPTRGFKTGTIDAYYFDEKGKCTVKGQGKLAIYTYPKKEWEKIVEKQKDILNAQSNFWLQALINRFEKQFNISKSKKECIEQNLNSVVAFVTDTENRAPFSFPYNNGYIYAGSMDGLISSKNEMPVWYQRVIVRGEYEAHTFINAADAKNGELPACVIWVTLYEFQNFLRNKLIEVQATPITRKVKPGRQPAPARTFKALFTDPLQMEKLLAAAASIGLLAKNGEGYAWGGIEPIIAGIGALWFTAKDAGMIKPRFKDKNSEATTKAIQLFLGMETLSKDTINNVNPYRSAYIRIKAALEKELKKQ